MLRRVEVAVPIYDEQLRRQINEMFIKMLSDNVQARIMLADGNYERVQKRGTSLNSQEFFYRNAYGVTEGKLL